MFKFYKIAVVLFIALSIQAISKDQKFTDANLVVSFPSTWTIEQDNGVVVSTVDNEDISIVFTIIESEDLDKALEAGMVEIRKQYTDLKLDEVKEETLDNVTVIYTDGKGKLTGDNGKLVNVELTIALVPGSNSKFLFIHGVATPDALDKFSKDIEFILKSIKPIK